MIGKRHLFTLQDGTRVYRVSGTTVRKRHVEFVQGGHGLVYRWIPKTEIWIERMSDRKDECAILFHEVKENRLMRYHGLKYEAAHKIANFDEQRIRRTGTNACKLVRRVFG